MVSGARSLSFLVVACLFAGCVTTPDGLGIQPNARTSLPQLQKLQPPPSLAGKELQLAQVEWVVPDADGGAIPDFLETKSEQYTEAFSQQLKQAGLRVLGADEVPMRGTPQLRISASAPRFSEQVNWQIDLLVDGSAVESLEHQTERFYLCEGDATCGEFQQGFLVGTLDVSEELVSHNANAILSRLFQSPKVARLGKGPAPVAASAKSWLSSIPEGSRLAVLEFRGALEQNVLLMFSDEARAGALQSLRGTGCSVMTRESMAAVLSDMGITSCTEGECEVETARNIGAGYVISGEILQWQGQHMAILKLHETAGGSLLATRRITAKEPLQLLEAIKPASLALFE